MLEFCSGLQPDQKLDKPVEQRQAEVDVVGG